MFEQIFIRLHNGLNRILILNSLLAWLLITMPHGHMVTSYFDRLSGKNESSNDISYSMLNKCRCQICHFPSKNDRCERGGTEIYNKNAQAREFCRVGYRFEETSIFAPDL